MRRYCAEFIATFVLVFAGTGAIVIDGVSGGVIGHLGVALTFGLVVMAMIHTLGEVSGAHMNPAVTIGFWVARRFPAADIGPYVAAQVAGAITASALLLLLFPEHGTLGNTVPAGSVGQSLLLEIVLAFILMFTIIHVAEGSKERGLLAGLTIGGVVGMEALFAGPVSGASMNPARSIGPALVSGNLTHLWIYIVAPLSGAVAAIFVCRWALSPDCCVGRKEVE